MKRNYLLLLALSCLLALVGCKKKKTEEPDPVPVPTAPPVEQGYYGLMSVSSFTAQMLSFGEFTGTEVSAYFDSKPVMDYEAYADSSLKMKAVLFNGDSVKLSNAGFYQLNNVGLSSQDWVVKGAAGIPDFERKGVVPAPVCSNIRALPGSISRSQGYALQLKGVGGITSAGVGISLADSAGNEAPTFSLSLKAGDNNIQVSPSQLPGLQKAAKAYAYVWLEKAEVAEFSGKRFRFRRMVQFVREITITL